MTVLTERLYMAYNDGKLDDISQSNSDARTQSFPEKLFSICHTPNTSSFDFRIFEIWFSFVF